jgi:hypothetical protein
MRRRVEWYNLNSKQIEKLSDILSDVGLVSLASVALPAIFGNLNILAALSGIMATFICWFASLALRK